MIRSFHKLAVCLVLLSSGTVHAVGPTKTRFDDPALVQPAIDGIRRLFEGYTLWGQGSWNGKDGETLRLRNVHASPTGKPQPDRVTMAVGYQWGSSDSWTSYYLTLVGGAKPVLQVVTDIEDVPFEPGSRTREGIIPEAQLTVGGSAVKVTSDEDGKPVTYSVTKTDGGIRWTEEHPEGTVTIDITMPSPR